MAFRLTSFVTTLLLLASSAFAQEIESATGDKTTGAITINVSAPAGYSNVIIKVVDKNGKVTAVSNGPTILPLEIERTPGTYYKVYASFTGKGQVEVMKDTEVTWN